MSQLRKTTQENYANAEEVPFIEVKNEAPIVPVKPVSAPPSLARRFANDLKKRIQPVHFYDFSEAVFALVDAFFRLLWSLVLLIIWAAIGLLIWLRELAEMPRKPSEPPPPTTNNDQQSTASGGITINQQFNINK